MKRRAFLKTSLPVAAGAIATAATAGVLSGEVLDTLEETEIDRLRSAMEEIKDILRRAAPEGAQLQGIAWGGPMGRENLGAWVKKDGVQLNFHDRSQGTEIVFN